ncbi:U3 small nucleolar ribonucleo MPP10-like isoform X1 [Chlorella sorokiniana]|uniref:U3 small nucleolar ribonucleo MPP10-like isoform X1 n=1 Tax=Chlorella sorokiniana TaxID=3076 RepID=A0A2P6TYD6_CHLSO|nr:U3 small nucleolar ribonucleo MPP10-like isoform X1 [Chlorella sorokiniana]|eukprot:PRW59087.1 U3 small nucleolar ribonucleo MPP10-like isoform X1 [Chlorella sorokiniana]
MLPESTIIELVLPERTEPCRCRVLSCSSTMVSVRLQELGTENVHRVSLKKLPYTVVEDADDAEAAEQQPGAADGPADQQQQQEEGSEDEEGGSGSEDDDNAAEQQPGGEPDPQPPAVSESDDDGSGSEEEDGEDAEEDTAAALDAFSDGTAAAVEAFAAAVESDPGAFLQPAPELASLAKSAAKALYDYQAAVDSSAAAAGGAGAAAAAAAAGPGALPELYIDGFDAEQIWLQLELAAAPALKRARKLLRKVGQEPQLLTPETEEAIDDLLEGADGSSEDDLSASGDEFEDEEEGSEDDEEGADLAGGSLEDIDYDALLAAGAAQQRKRAAAAAASDSEEEEAAAAAGKRPKLSKRAAAERAKVEDEHFKLDEMEAFVRQAEREAAGLLDEDDEGLAGSDEEEAALEALLEKATAVSARDKKKAKKARRKAAAAFGDIDMGDEDEDDDNPENAGKTAMFEDFFGPRTGVRQGAAQVTTGSGRRQQLDAFGGEEEEEEEDEDEEGFEDDMLSDDMLSGEEEEEEGQQQRRRGGQPEEDGFSDDDEEEEEEQEEEDAFAGEAAGWGRQRNMLAGSDEEEEGEEDELAPSAHERRQQRMAEKIRRLEEAAMGKKDWFMLGEVDAAERPKNSALEVDLDFETTVKPPPQPTEEMTRSLDDLIKGRITEGNFDDVVRLVAPPPEVKKATIELDDSKPQQGLGELYEAEYTRAVAGAADDKDEEVRQAARAQFSALCAKLDALSHLHFTPRPVIEEVTVKVDVPAIMMEEAAPQFVSGASMRAPEEVFASEAGGAPRAEEEMEREDRKRRRAQRKRSGKKRRAGKEEERAARAAAQGGTAPLAGRKSEAADREARKLERKAKKGGRSEFGKSAKVFGMIQQHMDGTTAAVRAQAAEAAAPRAAHLKL